MHLEIAPVIRGLHCWMPVKNGVLWCPELPPSAFVAFNLQKMTWPLFLFATFYMSGAVWEIRFCFSVSLSSCTRWVEWSGAQFQFENISTIRIWSTILCGVAHILLDMARYGAQKGPTCLTCVPVTLCRKILFLCCCSIYEGDKSYALKYQVPSNTMQYNAIPCNTMQ